MFIECLSTTYKKAWRYSTTFTRERVIFFGKVLNQTPTQLTDNSGHGFIHKAKNYMLLYINIPLLDGYVTKSINYQDLLKMMDETY